MLKIQILVDNPNSWYVDYAIELVAAINALGHNCVLIHEIAKVESGDILCLLSCEQIFKKLELNKYNLVVHASDLPKGKGWSPVSWQILEGKNDIPLTLFEAAEKVDSGVIYNKSFIKLRGDELWTEIKDLQGKETNKLILEFIKKYPKITFIPQVGESSFYKKRHPEDSKLDTNESISSQFNLLRICDNERYPAYFEIDGKRYVIKIYSS